MKKFMISVLGKPLTKKRARTGVGVSKAGKKFRWATTPDSWYEDMLREAFKIAYPNAEPIGYECCEEMPLDKDGNYDIDNYYWTIRKNVRDVDLPKVELDIIFYFEGGKIGDLDNYIKAVKDALNQYAWVDDRQVKHYKPFIVQENDLIMADEEAELARVDILVKEFDLWQNKLFLKLRKLLKSKCIQVDLTKKYYDKYDEEEV